MAALASASKTAQGAQGAQGPPPAAQLSARSLSLCSPLLAELLLPLLPDAAEPAPGGTPGEAPGGVVCSSSAAALFPGSSSGAPGAAEGSDDSDAASDDDSLPGAALKLTEGVPSVLLPLPPSAASAASCASAAPADCLVLPTAILAPPSPADPPPTAGSLARRFHSLCAELSAPGGSPVLVLLLRSGRFAAGIFQPSPNHAASPARCLAHKATTHYTVRKGQGGAQSSNDGAKGKAKSVGSQLRRAGEESLRLDVQAFLEENRGHLGRCGHLFLSVPNKMKKDFFGGGLVARDDGRIRGVPMTVKRPSFDAVKHVYEQLMVGKRRPLTREEVREITGERRRDEERERGEAAEARRKREEERRLRREAAGRPAAAGPGAAPATPYTPAHEAAASGDAAGLDDLLAAEGDVPGLSLGAGALEQTPLHLAAGLANPAAAARMIGALLRGGADPAALDSHGRSPYQVAGTDRAREAFRVPAGLTEEAIKAKKEKEKEKKKRQKEKAKLKKAEEREEERQEEEKAREEAEAAKAADDAKRARAGLRSKEKANACDMCGKVVRRRADMFNRLDWAYCSTDCVKGHQREMAAQAAMARMAVK
ncbi:hypothetical protein TeGR_g4490 [Tetraparma gracilis]|uniref:VLRF1 domain-containing protein n=1 Tax=Tetraparma gracilis TaxID=2962635 RepID=A0ABQ6MFW3_9STRA|nr:hypothetical protein TeGR_g4490 [Tetraparma gracilis]